MPSEPIETKALLHVANETELKLPTPLSRTVGYVLVGASEQSEILLWH